MAKVRFTAPKLAAFKCPAGKAQAFMWDSIAPGLGYRVTANGSRSFIFQGRFDGQTLRMTVGDPQSWTIDGAQAEARRLQGLIDQGRDPRQEKAAAIAQDRAARTAAKVGKQRLEITGLSAWAAYCEARRPSWSERNHQDHLAFASAGGVKRKRAEGKTVAGPLYGLLKRPLALIDSEAVRLWVERETKTRPARALLGFRLLRAFINWCTEDETYASLVQPDACKPKKTRQALPKVVAKDDALQREQLKLWFAEVQKLPNPVAAAYLQGLLLTGARREELAGLRWEDVDFQWKTMTIRDKVEGQRTIPLTPYVAYLLSALPRRNEWVFSSTQVLDQGTKNAKRRARYHEEKGQEAPVGAVVFRSASGRMQDPRINHNKALQAAGLPHLTLHGLRRSFGTLAEWVEVPVGIVAQIMGHTPSAIAEKHYRVRPIDLLRMWHQKIEAWILEQAGIEFDAEQPLGLHVAAN